jgi:hypothetical protein
VNKKSLELVLIKPNNCPYLFFNPSLTYFNDKNNLKIIEQIRDINIPNTGEITIFSK